jgi:hypothetical protein
LEIEVFFSVLKLLAPEAIFSAPSTLASSSFPRTLDVSFFAGGGFARMDEGEDRESPLLNRGAIGAQLLRINRVRSRTRAET